MLNLHQKSLCGLAFLAAAAMAKALATPADSDVLRLVPGGAQVVSGISDRGTSSATGRLLVVTENNNRDLDDCRTLLGVDGQKAINEVIEAADSSIAGDLSDHLLLVAGSFDHARVFKAALENGAGRAEYDGRELLVLRPFGRESPSMKDVRWLAILENRVLVFGVPRMVAKALDRYERHEPADPILLQRLARVHSDVNSWSIVAMPAPILTKHLALGNIPASLETILKDADEVELGIHYGRNARIDLSIHSAGSDPGDGLLSRAQPILASFAPAPRSHLHVGMVGQGRIQGSMTIREKEFDEWLAALERSRSGSRESRNGEQR